MKAAARVCHQSGVTPLSLCWLCMCWQPRVLIALPLSAPKCEAVLILRLQINYRQ